MVEPRYMLMVRVGGTPGEAQTWAALLVPGQGRVLTRDEAEIIALPDHRPRFLLPYTDETARFGPPAGKAPALTMSPGETIWDYGEPTRVDLHAVLRAAAATADPEAARSSPDPGVIPLSPHLRGRSDRLTLDRGVDGAATACRQTPGRLRNTTRDYRRPGGKANAPCRTLTASVHSAEQLKTERFGRQVWQAPQNEP